MCAYVIIIVGKLVHTKSTTFCRSCNPLTILHGVAKHHFHVTLVHVILHWPRFLSGLHWKIHCYSMGNCVCASISLQQGIILYIDQDFTFVGNGKHGPSDTLPSQLICNKTRNMIGTRFIYQSFYNTGLYLKKNANCSLFMLLNK